MPPPINFKQDLDFNFIQQTNIYYISFQGWVRTISGLSTVAIIDKEAEQCSQDRTSISAKLVIFKLRLALATFWAEHCSKGTERRG